MYRLTNDLFVVVWLLIYYFGVLYLFTKVRYSISETASSNRLIVVAFFLISLFVNHSLAMWIMNEWSEGFAKSFGLIFK